MGCTTLEEADGEGRALAVRLCEHPEYGKDERGEDNGC